MSPFAKISRRAAQIYPLLLLAALTLAGLLSTHAALTHAITRSQDFQWSGERLLLHHIDPWQIYLAGNPNHALIETQVPNYLPILYVLLVPFGLMPLAAANLAWALCNLLFATASALLAARFYGLRGPAWALGITAALLAATPTRISISNGQQGLFILFLWSLALLPIRTHSPQNRTSPRSALLIGISYLKYSFAPAIALYLLLRNGLRRTGLRRGTLTLLITLLPSALATIVLWLWIHQPHTLRSLLTLTLAPLVVAKSGYQPTSDPGQTLMDLAEYLLGGAHVMTPRLTAATFVLAIALNLLVLLLALRKLRRANETTATTNPKPTNPDTTSPITSPDPTGWLLALTALMSFAFYKHHPYDEIVFLFAACHCLQHRRRPLALAALALIAYHWYLQRYVDTLLGFSFTWSEIRLASFFALIALIYALGPTPQTNPALPPQPAALAHPPIPEAA